MGLIRTNIAASRRPAWCERLAMLPETRYAKSGDVHIAYQMIGKGPFDLVFVPGFISHLDHVWEEPRWAGFLERLASFSRLICFDKRGTGLSDRVSAIPTLEERMDDVRAGDGCRRIRTRCVVRHFRGRPDVAAVCC
jgi:pimeloyl-ACP methyl ester carboxylesterase